MARAQSHEPTPEPRLREPPEPLGEREAREGAAKPSWSYRIAGWIVPERYPAEVVYGLITVGALLAAESGLKDTYPETVGSTAIAMTLYWFAHAYADALGLRLSEQRRVSWTELWHTFARDWSIVRGAVFPLMALLVAWAAGASQTEAVTAAVWTVVASLIAFELAAGVRSKAKPVELAFDVSAGTALGLGILALRALLH
jgi:signal transduction histidine kinase